MATITDTMRDVEREIRSVLDKCDHGFSVHSRCPMGCDEERES